MKELSLSDLLLLFTHCKKVFDSYDSPIEYEMKQRDKWGIRLDKVEYELNQRLEELFNKQNQ